MRIPVIYSTRNFANRKLTALLTASGMALVVYVYATVLMLTEGLEKTLVETGSYGNVVVIRRSSETEIQSGIEREQAAIVASLPEIARGSNGGALISKEVVVLINLPKRDSDKPSNVTIRGLSGIGLELRPQAKVVEGRMFAPGSSEIVTGRSIAQRFQGGGIGETLRFGMRDWTVVGVLDSGGSSFDSEIWGDADQMMQAFRRQGYSSTVFRLSEPGAFEAVKKTIEDDQRLTLEAKRESVFYAEQSEVMAKFIRILGGVLSAIFSIGAIIGAMITMYASVANRTHEIGTLRALGFDKTSILSAFLLESLLLGLTGGVAGLILASLMQVLSISTMNWQTFAELAFTFTLTPAIVVESLIFALAMGLLGGFLPALRAARMNIVDALRAA
ncbi:MAG: ABC transporter permease [Burkholderiales bacterium]